MSDLYGPAARELQDRFDARRLADRVERLVHDALSDGDRAFIERADMLFLATVDPAGRVNCSYKGGDPGFVRVLDPRTLAFPSYDGNAMYLSMGNVVATHEVGLLFIDFDDRRRMRLNGRATIDLADPLLADYPEAQLIVRVAVRQVFPNCARYIHQYRLVERSRFVPRAGRATPVPAWKHNGWAKDALPHGDPALEEGREVRKA